MLPDIDTTGRVLNAPIRAIVEKWYPRSQGDARERKIQVRWAKMDAAIMEYFQTSGLDRSARIYLSVCRCHPTSLSLTLLTQYAGVENNCIVYLSRVRIYPHGPRGATVTTPLPKRMLISLKHSPPPFDF